MKHKDKEVLQSNNKVFHNLKELTSFNKYLMIESRLQVECKMICPIEILLYVTLRDI